MKYLYNPPLLVKKIFNQYQWESITDNVLFTFDDGPIPETTEIILNELQNQKVKGVFFCVGENVKKNRSLVKAMLDEGHIIGNHTFSHKSLRKLSKDEINNEIISFNNLMKDDFSYTVKYFRPPYGKIRLISDKIIKQLGMKTVMWSLLTYDYKNDINLVKFTLKKYLKSNSIIVLHDSLKSQQIIIDAIKIIIDEVHNKNFKIGIPGICLK